MSTPPVLTIHAGPCLFSGPAPPSDVLARSSAGFFVAATPKPAYSQSTACSADGPGLWGNGQTDGAAVS
jgi:hypothetical protein